MNSPAINLGDPAAVAGSGGVPQFDQRGNPRVLVGQIDIGAVEVGPVLPGDYNRNQIVDAGDYILWRKTQGATVPHYAGADGNGDTVIDGADLMVWKQNFGNMLSGAGAGGGASASNSADAFNESQASANSPSNPEAGGLGGSAGIASIPESEVQGSAEAIVWFDGPPASQAVSIKTVQSEPVATTSASPEILLLAISLLYTDDADGSIIEESSEVNGRPPSSTISALDAVFSDAVEDLSVAWQDL
jgi:hypothetical protein